MSQQNFKYLCNSIPELLNVFEDPAQYVHTIAVIYVCSRITLLIINVFPQVYHTTVNGETGKVQIFTYSFDVIVLCTLYVSVLN